MLQGQRSYCQAGQLAALRLSLRRHRCRGTRPFTVRRRRGSGQQPHHCRPGKGAPRLPEVGQDFRRHGIRQPSGGASCGKETKV